MIRSRVCIDRRLSVARERIVVSARRWLEAPGRAGTHLGQRGNVRVRSFPDSQQLRVRLDCRVTVTHGNTRTRQAEQ